MGCNVSKVEPEEEAPSGLRLVQKGIEEIKRKRRVRKGSISNTELLRPEDLEASEDDEASVKEPSAPAKQAAPTAEDVCGGLKLAAPLPEEVTATAVEEEKADEAEKKRSEREEANGRKLGSAAKHDEELPGSPSFRFYFIATANDSDDDSVKAGLGKRESNLEETKQGNSHGRNESETSSEDSELKTQKKEKGKKFRVLTKAPNAVYNLLNVRNCYCNNSAHAIGVQESPQLVTRKAA